MIASRIAESVIRRRGVVLLRAGPNANSASSTAAATITTR